MFMQSAIILHAQHLNGAQQRCYKCATCTIIFFTMIIFACTTNYWCTAYMHNSYFSHSCTISMYIFVVVHCTFNILVVHVFASYATTVHNDNKKILSRCDLTNCIKKPPKSTIGRDKKLDRVGPVHNRPFTDKLHHFVKKRRGRGPPM